jgi:hypothetical protein
MTPAESNAEPNDAVSLAELGFELWKGLALAPFAPPAALEAELRKLRARWFAELGAIVEESMRSAWFLKFMSQGLGALNRSTPVFARLWVLTTAERSRE